MTVKYGFGELMQMDSLALVIMKLELNHFL
jgi:hypothetical protein